MAVSSSVPLRVGLLGYGAAGSVFHAPLIAVTHGLRRDAVVTSSPERQAQVRREHPEARVLDRPAQLWEDGGLDLVVVATPNRFHASFGPDRDCGRPAGCGGQAARGHVRRRPPCRRASASERRTDHRVRKPAVGR